MEPLSQISSKIKGKNSNNMEEPLPSIPNIKPIENPKQDETNNQLSIVVAATPISCRPLEDATVHQTMDMDEGTEEVDNTDVSAKRLSAFLRPLRLTGWHQYKTLRRNEKTIDKFYIHIASDIQFRSLNEVDDFIIHGLLPSRSQKKAAPAQPPTENGQASEAPKKRGRKRLNWKFFQTEHDPDIFDIRFLTDEEMRQSDEKLIVEKFLEDSYNNLLALSPKTTVPKRKKAKTEKALEGPSTSNQGN